MATTVSCRWPPPWTVVQEPRGDIDETLTFTFSPNFPGSMTGTCTVTGRAAQPLSGSDAYDFICGEPASPERRFRIGGLSGYQQDVA